MLAMPAFGQNFPVSTTVLETTRAEITNFSVISGNAVGFLFTIHNEGNTNISVFPEITVYDPDNNTVEQLIYDTEVNVSAGSLKDLKLSWNTNNQGSFTAKLVVFYDNNSRSTAALRTFVSSAHTPTREGSGKGRAAVTPKPAVTPEVAPIQHIPQQHQPAGTAASASTASILIGILAGIIGFVLPKEGGTASFYWISGAGIGAVLLFILKLFRHI